MLQYLGITRDIPLPDEQELVAKLKGMMNSPVYEQPAFDLVAKHKSDVETWLKGSNMTGKQIWRLLKEIFRIEIDYTIINATSEKEFSFGRPKVTIRMETSPGIEAQLDFGYVGLMYNPDMQKMKKTWAFIMT